jgi:hypothetical protein
MWMKSYSLYHKHFRNFISKILLVFLFCNFWTFDRLFSQEYTLIATYPFIRQFAAEDSFHNKYSLENGQVIRFSPDSTSDTYSNRQYGPVAKIDVSDPFNIIVFFKDFGTVAILDNNLSEKTIIPPHRLHDNDIPSQVCFSSQHGFWAFFPNSFLLARYNFRGNRAVLSEDLSLRTGINTEVLFMQENNERLFIYANGLWVFDLHANFIFNLQQIRTPMIQVKESKIFYLENDRLFVYDFFLKQEDVFLLPEKDVKNFYLKNSETILLQTSLSLLEFKISGKFF